MNLLLVDILGALLALAKMVVGCRVLSQVKAQQQPSADLQLNTEQKQKGAMYREMQP